MSAVIATMLAGQFFFGDQTDRTLRETRRRVREYADCIVKKRPGDAQAAVLSTGENATLVREYPKIVDWSCLTGFVDQMAFPGDLLRYALADALVRRELVNQPALDPASIPPLDHRDPVPPPSVTQASEANKAFDRERWKFGVALAYSQVSHFGECVVRSDPNGARLMLASKPTSPAEGAAIAALRPSLSACLDKGNKLNLTKEVLRGTIALNYYRMAKAPRVVEAAK